MLYAYYLLNILYNIVFREHPVSVTVGVVYLGQEYELLAANTWNIIRRKAPVVIYKGQNVKIVGDLLITKFIDQKIIFVNYTDTAVEIEPSSTFVSTSTQAVSSTTTDLPFITYSKQHIFSKFMRIHFIN